MNPDSTVSTPLAWHADALWQQLEPYLPGLSVEVLAQVESTNSVLLERARQGSGRHDAPITTPGELEALRRRGVPVDAAPSSADAPFGRRQGDTQPCLLVAEHQSLGRGRQGRTWLSDPAASLAFSIALPLAPRDWCGLSLAVGVALADALEPPEPGRVAQRIALKWPNDLWLADQPAKGSGHGRKLGGVLIETVPVGRRRMVIVGVGLNVAPLAPSRDTRDLASGFACLREIDRAATPPAVLHRIALPLVRAILQFEREGFAGFSGAYARRDRLRGQPVRLTGPRGELLHEGTAESVAANGALRIRDAAGIVHEVSSGEVSLRLLPPLAGTAAGVAAA